VSINYFADLVSVCSSQILSRYIKNSFSVKKYTSNIGIANYYLSYATHLANFMYSFVIAQSLFQGILFCEEYDEKATIFFFGLKLQRIQ
jgi:hypothetical protein